MTGTFKIQYRNWRGELAPRTIRPYRFWWGHTSFHPDPQWLLHGMDVERGVERDFCVSGMTGFPVFDVKVPKEEARALLMAEVAKRMAESGTAAVAVPSVARVGLEMQDHSQLASLKAQQED
jgi:hypothetical protein